MKLLPLASSLFFLTSLSTGAATFPPANTIVWEGNPASARTLNTGGREAKLMQGASVESSNFSARLIDPIANAQERAASVRVNVAGLALIDPHQANEQPKSGQGHIHYQVDDGPEIATIAPNLDFHELKPGRHKIKVTLVGNDHQALGPAQTLDVLIPR